MVLDQPCRILNAQTPKITRQYVSFGFERELSGVVSAIPFADQIVVELLLDGVGDELFDHCVGVPIRDRTLAHCPLTTVYLRLMYA